MAATSQVFVEPCAVAVALPEAQLALCRRVLARAKLRVHALDDVAVAPASITTLMPRLVVLPATSPQRDLEAVHDAAVAVGAALFLLSEDENEQTIERHLTKVVKDVQARFARPRRP